MKKSSVEIAIFIRHLREKEEPGKSFGMNCILTSDDLIRSKETLYKLLEALPGVGQKEGYINESEKKLLKEILSDINT